MEDDSRQRIIDERSQLAGQLGKLIKYKKQENTHIYDINIARTKFKLRSLENKLK